MSHVYEERDISYKGRVLVSAACDECGEALEVGTWSDSKPHEKFTKNSLTVRVGGGYYGFWDGNADVELCAECAKRLLTAIPSILKALREERGF